MARVGDWRVPSQVGGWWFRYKGDVLIADASSQSWIDRLKPGPLGGDGIGSLSSRDLIPGRDATVWELAVIDARMVLSRGIRVSRGA